jgi:aryl-alcohol dehydrogenase-like predicted oxidoreductase
MQFRALGESGIKASVIGLGTWAIGGRPGRGTDETQSIRTIQQAIASGINLIDTAPVYGLGLAEEIVGKAIADRRREVILATKCGLVWKTDKGSYFFDEYDTKVYKYLGAGSIRWEIDQSLKRLKTDYIDLYQTHWQDETTPIEETMGVLMDLKNEGKIRAIGVSNAVADDLRRYQSIGPVDSDHELYNMLDRDIENEHVPFCHENNIAILAYSPLCKGLLTGKVGPERTFADTDLRKHDPRFSRENRIAVAEMLDAYKPITLRHRLTLGQVALAWTVAQPGITHALVGARSPEQASENAQAGEVTLTEEELDTIDLAIARHAPLPTAVR